MFRDYCSSCRGVSAGADRASSPPAAVSDSGQPPFGRAAPAGVGVRTPPAYAIDVDGASWSLAPIMIAVGDDPRMARWQNRLFIALAQNAASAAELLRPPRRADRGHVLARLRLSVIGQSVASARRGACTRARSGAGAPSSGRSRSGGRPPATYAAAAWVCAAGAKGVRTTSAAA